MKLRTIAIALMLMFLSTDRLFAEEGWLTKLNPFTYMSSSRSTTAARRTGPTTLQKMNRGARNMVSRTVDFLTPWDNYPAPAQAKSKQKGWGLLSWNSQPEEPEIQTVNDFLNLPRPKY